MQIGTDNPWSLPKHQGHMLYQEIQDVTDYFTFHVCDGDALLPDSLNDFYELNMEQYACRYKVE